MRSFDCLMQMMDLPIWLAMHEEQRVLRRVRLLFDHLAEGLGRYVAGAGASGR